MPRPLALWTIALLLAAIGARRRRVDERPHERRSGVGLVRLIARAPVAQAIALRAATPAVHANVRAAAVDDLGAQHVARARTACLQYGLLLAAGLALAGPLPAALGMAAAALGYALPAIWIGAAARRRRHLVVADLPDLIDVVVLCTEAGMALEPALRLASTRMSGPCSDEIAATLKAMDLGATRRDAYRAMATRIGAPQIQGLVGALLQAEELGSPVNDALTRQSELLRAGRSQAVRDAAARAAPKVQLVVAMIMVPGALLVVVGVMVLQLIGQLGAVAGGMP